MAYLLSVWYKECVVGGYCIVNYSREARRVQGSVEVRSEFRATWRNYRPWLEGAKRATPLSNGRVPFPEGGAPTVQCAVCFLPCLSVLSVCLSVCTLNQPPPASRLSLADLFNSPPHHLTTSPLLHNPPDHPRALSCSPLPPPGNAASRLALLPTFSTFVHLPHHHQLRRHQFGASERASGTTRGISSSPPTVFPCTSLPSLRPPPLRDHLHHLSSSSSINPRRLLR